ncbi:MAG: DUF3307 domain-containing protein [Massilibacteroides sp.]|nr:DUF3307 domain-containing protein [Massilibacteroides sp.]
MAQFLVLQWFAHILSDFYFQNDRMCKEKDEKGFASQALYIHSFIVFVMTVAFSVLSLFSFDFLGWAVFIAVTHLILDGLKHFMKGRSPLIVDGSKRYWKGCSSIFFIDQLIHWVVIAIVVYLFNESNPIVVQLWFPDTWLLVATLIFLICLKPTNIMIKNVLTANLIGISQLENKEELKNAGLLIGNLERTLTLILVVIGHYEVVGFIIAAKSILRFKESDTAKTEYVLVGTLLSYSVALIGGLIIVYFKNGACG